MFAENSNLRTAVVGNCTALAIEGMGAIDNLLLAAGLDGIAGTISTSFGVDAIYAPATADAASASLHWRFTTPFPVKRTLAIIKPGTTDQYLCPIMEAVRANGFSLQLKGKFFNKKTKT